MTATLLLTYAVLHKEDDHLLYFTLNPDILHTTDWLIANCYVKKVMLRKKSGMVSYTLNNLPYTAHSEDSVFYNLPSSFYNDILHHKNYEEEELTDWLLSKLPHGSGIDYAWEFTFLQNGKIKAHNSYHAMDEWGGYCHIYDFYATIHINHLFSLMFERVFFTSGCKEYSCCGYELKSYLSDTIAESLH